MNNIDFIITATILQIQIPQGKQEHPSFLLSNKKQLIFQIPLSIKKLYKQNKFALYNHKSFLITPKLYSPKKKQHYTSISMKFKGNPDPFCKHSQSEQSMQIQKSLTEQSSIQSQPQTYYRCSQNSDDQQDPINQNHQLQRIQNYQRISKCFLCLQTSSHLILWLRSNLYKKENNFYGRYLKTVNRILQKKIHTSTYISYKQMLMRTKQASILNQMEYKDWGKIINEIKGSISKRLWNSTSRIKKEILFTQKLQQQTVRLDDNGQYVYDRMYLIEGSVMLRYQKRRRALKHYQLQLLQQRQLNAERNLNKVGNIKYESQLNDIKHKQLEEYRLGLKQRHKLHLIENRQVLNKMLHGKLLQEQQLKSEYQFYPVEVILNRIEQQGTIQQGLKSKCQQQKDNKALRRVSISQQQHQYQASLQSSTLQLNRLKTQLSLMIASLKLQQTYYTTHYQKYLGDHNKGESTLPIKGNQTAQNKMKLQSLDLNKYQDNKHNNNQQYHSYSMQLDISGILQQQRQKHCGQNYYYQHNNEKQQQSSQNKNKYSISKSKRRNKSKNKIGKKILTNISKNYYNQKQQYNYQSERILTTLDLYNYSYKNQQQKRNFTNLKTDNQCITKYLTNNNQNDQKEEDDSKYGQMYQKLLQQNNNKIKSKSKLRANQNKRSKSNLNRKSKSTQKISIKDNKNITNNSRVYKNNNNFYTDPDNYNNKNCSKVKTKIKMAFNNKHSQEKLDNENIGPFGDKLVRNKQMSKDICLNKERVIDNHSIQLKIKKSNHNTLHSENKNTNGNFSCEFYNTQNKKKIQLEMLSSRRLQTENARDDDCSQQIGQQINSKDNFKFDLSKSKKVNITSSTKFTKRNNNKDSININMKSSENSNNKMMMGSFLSCHLTGDNKRKSISLSKQKSKSKSHHKSRLKNKTHQNNIVVNRCNNNSNSNFNNIGGEFNCDRNPNPEYRLGDRYNHKAKQKHDSNLKTQEQAPKQFCLGNMNATNMSSNTKQAVTNMDSKQTESNMDRKQIVSKNSRLVLLNKKSSR